MPRLAAKTEGRGNGIKTNVLNITELAGKSKWSKRQAHTDKLLSRITPLMRLIHVLCRRYFKTTFSDHQGVL